MAGLTGRQSGALRLVYEEDLTQEEAGKRMGITKTGVYNLLEMAIGNVSEVYYYWSRHGEGYAYGGL